MDAIPASLCRLLSQQSFTCSLMSCTRSSYRLRFDCSLAILSCMLCIESITFVSYFSLTSISIISLSKTSAAIEISLIDLLFSGSIISSIKVRGFVKFTISYWSCNSVNGSALSTSILLALGSLSAVFAFWISVSSFIIYLPRSYCFRFFDVTIPPLLLFLASIR